MRRGKANNLPWRYDFGFLAESQTCWKPRGYLDIGRLDLPSWAVTNREHPDRLRTLINFINDAIDVRLLAVKQVPQFPPQLSRFRGYSTAIGVGRKRVYRLLQPVVPSRGRLGFGSVLFHIKGFEITRCALGKLNVIFHDCAACRQRPLWRGGVPPLPPHQTPGRFPPSKPPAPRSSRTAG